MGNDGRGGWEGVVPVFNLSSVMLSDGAQICAYCVIFRFSPPLHSHYTSLEENWGGCRHTWRPLQLLHGYIGVTIPHLYVFVWTDH